MNKLDSRIRLFFFVLSFLAAIVVTAQNPIPEQTGGVYYTYHFDNSRQTPAPKGYKPFYISHYGRHGSRWQSTDAAYTGVLDVFSKAFAANALSPVGKDVYHRLQIICNDAVGKHAGDLSPLGVLQHRQIAGRMFNNFPEIFKGDKTVIARSTIVPRCILSMANCCDHLKTLNPDLNFSFSANGETTSVLNFIENENLLNDEYKTIKDSKNAEWRSVQRSFEEENINPERFINALFSDQTYSNDSINGISLMRSLFSVAVIMQNVDLQISLYDIFTPSELHRLWQYYNYQYYVRLASSPVNKEYPQQYARVLLDDFIGRADNAIANSYPAADLRFGHDVDLIPFAALLHLEGCDARETDIEKISKVWQAYNVSPMAANIQLVFFSKKHSDDILVKFLHNEKETKIPLETDVFPYYHWKDIKQYYE